MPLRTCMQQHTERDLRLWLAYFDAQLDRPNRTDCYLMQIACEVRRVLSSKPGEIKLKDFKLKFGEEEEKPAVHQPTDEEKEQQTRTREEERAVQQERLANVSKAKWLHLVGPDVEVREIPRSALLPEDQWEVQP